MVGSRPMSHQYVTHQDRFYLFVKRGSGLPGEYKTENTAFAGQCACSLHFGRRRSIDSSESRARAGMLLNAVLICSMVAANAEPTLNSYSFTGGSNGYDYSNSVTNNGYLGSKDRYENVGSFYDTGDSSRKLSNHIASHSLINAGNQGNIGDDTGNGYNVYAANDHGSDYTGYSDTYENPDSPRDSYVSSARATTPVQGMSFRAYSVSQYDNNGAPTFNAYSSGSIYQDNDFDRYGNNNKRTPSYPGYSKPAATVQLENYAEDSSEDNSDAQGYRDDSSSGVYSDSDQVYPSYSSSEYAYGKQKADPYNFKGRNRYGDNVYQTASEMRYARGNAAHVGHNRDVPSYLSDPRPNGQFFRTHGASSGYTPGKPKYNYKYLPRYAPNNRPSYSRERDAYYAAYGKDGGKIVIIKDNRPSYSDRAYSDADNDSGYRSKNGGFTGDYTSNFNRYPASSSSNYDDGPAILRRYRYASPLLLQKTVYS